jgi:acyl-CoA reductase-like NAD-dependent aldehyde dehydrogenase
LIFEGTGKNPFVVMPGADIADAVKNGLRGGLINGGQSVYASELFFIHDSLYNEFAEKLVDGAAELYCGRPEDEETDIGPVYSDDILNNIIMQVTDAKQRGAAILTGGRLFETAGRQGYLPTVLSGCTMQMKITSHTNYGPVFPLISFTTETELIDMLDQLLYALDAAVIGDASSLLLHYLQKNYRNVFINSIVASSENTMSQLVDGGFRNAAYIWEWQGNQFAQREGPRIMTQEICREQ